MESFGNEIRVQQGEDWNLDKLLSSSSREYIPYIISSERANPFFVVTVASTKYEKNLRYVKSWWNSAEELHIPRFYQTTPLFYGDVEESDLPSDPSTNPSDPTYGDSKETRYLYYYTKVVIDDDEDIEPIDKSVGHKKYYYFYFEYDEDGECTRRVDGYDCRIIFNFSSRETQKWGGQDYLYQITLVSGQLMADRLEEIRAEYQPEDWPETIEEQYKYVKLSYPNELQPDIDVDSPLGYIEVPEVILQPTKLQVDNNLRTII